LAASAHTLSVSEICHLGDILIEENEFAGRDGKVSRRTTVKGAAWSVPVVAMAAAVPMASASTVACPPSQTILATDSSEGLLSVSVPPQVKTIRYTIAGGQGNYAAGDASPAGRGALFSGEIPVSALGGATVLQLIAGQKGGVGAGQNGGVGFGNGGSGGEPHRPSTEVVEALVVPSWWGTRLSLSQVAAAAPVAAIKALETPL